MLKGKILIILFSIAASLSLFTQGCRNQAGKLPENVLDKQTMINLLTDMQLVEAALAVKQSRNAADPSVPRIYYDSLFAKYNITKAVVDSSLKYYGRQPEIFEELYAQVIIRLSRIEHDNAMREKSRADTLLVHDTIQAKDSLNLPKPPKEETQPATSITEQPVH